MTRSYLVYQNYFKGQYLGIDNDIYVEVGDLLGPPIRGKPFVGNSVTTRVQIRVGVTNTAGLARFHSKLEIALRFAPATNRDCILVVGMHCTGDAGNSEVRLSRRANIVQT